MSKSFLDLLPRNYFSGAGVRAGLTGRARTFRVRRESKSTKNTHQRNIYWDYKIGKRIAKVCHRVGLPPVDNAILYLVLDLVGIGGFASLGLLNPLLQQASLNRIWRAAGSAR